MLKAVQVTIRTQVLAGWTNNASLSNTKKDETFGTLYSLRLIRRARTSEAGALGDVSLQR